MKSTLLCLGGMMALALVLAAPALRAEEAAPPNPKLAERAAELAIDNNDPDAIDPNTIRGDAWTLQFEYEPPTAIVVKDPDGVKHVYWYIVYTVTNTSKDEHHFTPAFTLMSDIGVVRKIGIYPTAYEAIKMNRKIPFLENAVKMIGPIYPGVDNARTGVAIFSPLETRSETFSIFVEGLSGKYIERQKVGTPGAAKPAAVKPAAEKPAEKAAEDETPAPKAGKKGAPAASEPGKPTAQEIAAREAGTVRLRYTLELQYKVPTDELWVNLDKPVFLGKRWTWR